MRYQASVLAGIIAAGFQTSHVQAESCGNGAPSHYGNQGASSRNFQRVATLANYLNNQDASATTVSEITTSTKDGKLLIYTDSPMGEVGFVDLTVPSIPVALGKLAVPGEPTSVATLGNSHALVAVDTSASFTEPSGLLVVIELATRTVVREIPLAGQPDSIKVSGDGKYAAIAIESQRDEEVVVDGEEGGLPQLPAGSLAIVDLCVDPGVWTVRYAELTGLSAYAPEDPEPEFVDIDSRNRVVVSLQENNHLAIADLASGEVRAHFPTGAQTLVGVDATEDGVISLTETLEDVPRGAGRRRVGLRGR